MDWGCQRPQLEPGSGLGTEGCLWGREAVGAYGVCPWWAKEGGSWLPRPPHPPHPLPPQPRLPDRAPPRLGSIAEIDLGVPPPVMKTFKEFLLSLDDSVDETEAVKRYNDYKLDFRRQQMQDFFLAHKDEEW